MHIGIPKPRISRAAIYMPTAGQISRPVKTTLEVLTTLGASLNNSTDQHDDRSDGYCPSSSKPLIGNGHEGQREDCSERICCTNDTLQGSLRIVKVFRQSVSTLVSKRRRWHTFDPGWDNLKGINQLGVKSRGQFNTHACWKEHKVEESQVWFLIPTNLVLFDNPSEDRFCCSYLASGRLSDFCHSFRLVDRIGC